MSSAVGSGPLSLSTFSAGPWNAEGSRPATGGQSEGILDGEVVGAVNALAPHPEDSGILYIGSVNGGIWRTADAMSARPTWQPLTDQMSSLSIGALNLDPTDPSRQTLAAGTGRFSSLRRSGGALVGVLRTVDGGANWTVHDNAGEFRNAHITGVAARGATIVATSNNRGQFRSADAGATWQQLSALPASGIPPGNSFDLAGDPSDASCLFTHAGDRGVFRSIDTGATWTKVSDTAIDGMLRLNLTNVRIAVGNTGNVYLAIASSNRLAGLFRSADRGATWKALDLPITRERAGTTFGVHPGGQAAIHMSLAADPRNPTIVYVGGDRQPGFDEAAPAPTPMPWPNSIGARNYSGRLFRVDASLPSGSQAAHITHSNTASGSSPHADSRDLAVAANGVLLDADDGGVYRRTKPDKDDGDWFSTNGSLQISEYHSVAWDANTKTVIGGAQDTGIQQQERASPDRWPSVVQADGAVVVVDTNGPAGLSVRYSSWQHLGSLRREVYDSSGVLLSRKRLSLSVEAGGPPLAPQFYTPIRLNHLRAGRLIFGAANGVYESLTEGETVRHIAPLVASQSGAIAYGAADNEDILYVGSGSQVMIRLAAHPAPLAPSTTFPGGAPIQAIAIDPGNHKTAFAIDMEDVFRTGDAGATWSIVTSNLRTVGANVLRSAVFCPTLGSGTLVVGSNSGVFAAEAPSFATWMRIGTGLPLAPVLSLQYSDVDRLVLAGTQGRGAWTLKFPVSPVA